MNVVLSTTSDNTVTLCNTAFYPSVECGTHVSHVVIKIPDDNMIVLSKQSQMLLNFINKEVPKYLTEKIEPHNHVKQNFHPVKQETMLFSKILTDTVAAAEKENNGDPFFTYKQVLARISGEAKNLEQKISALFSVKETTPSTTSENTVETVNQLHKNYLTLMQLLTSTMEDLIYTQQNQDRDYFMFTPPEHVYKLLNKKHSNVEKGTNFFKTVNNKMFIKILETTTPLTVKPENIFTRYNIGENNEMLTEIVLTDTGKTFTPTVKTYSWVKLTPTVQKMVEKEFHTTILNLIEEAEKTFHHIMLVGNKINDQLQHVKKRKTFPIG